MTLEEEIGMVREKMKAWEDGFRHAAKASGSRDAPDVPNVFRDIREVLGRARYEVSVLRAQLGHQRQLLQEQATKAA